MLAKLSVERYPLARFFVMRMTRLSPSATALVIPPTEAITPSQWFSRVRANFLSGSILLSLARFFHALRNFSAQPM